MGPVCPALGLLWWWELLRVGGRAYLPATWNKHGWQKSLPTCSKQPVCCRVEWELLRAGAMVYFSATRSKHGWKKSLPACSKQPFSPALRLGWDPLRADERAFFPAARNQHRWEKSLPAALSRQFVLGWGWGISLGQPRGHFFVCIL